MNKFKKMRGMQVLAGGALLMLANFACAQFVWIDAKGLKQFSDMPPPTSVPQHKILKQPGRTDGGAADAAQNPADTAAQKPAAAAAQSTADRELDYRKRNKEKAEAETKAAGAADDLAKKKSACDAARARNTALAKGKRLRGPDNAILDDQARAAQQAMTNQVLAECE